MASVHKCVEWVEGCLEREPSALSAVGKSVELASDGRASQESGEGPRSLPGPGLGLSS